MSFLEQEQQKLEMAMWHEITRKNPHLPHHLPQAEDREYRDAL